MGSVMLTKLHTGAKRMRGAIAAAAVLPLLAGCQRMVVMMPDGDVAGQQRNLILIATLIMLTIIVPVMVATVVFAWRYRAGRSANYDPHFDHSTGLELLIWSFPLLLITIIGAITWSSTHLLDPFRPLNRIAPGKPLAPNAKHLEVQVVAMDWKWLFIYPEQGIATVNELALPVDVPVRFHITSTSQFATFYAPTLAGMIYAMPGMRSMLHAVINKPTESFGFSGNYTGQGHSDNRFALYGLEPARFDQWVGRVKASGGALTRADYLRLEKPSEKVPVQRYAAVQPGLFDRVVQRCVEDNKPCMAAMMRSDMARAGGRPHEMRPGAGMPMGRNALPVGERTPVPALQKAPEDKGSGPNVTKPDTPADAPGQRKPGDPQNRGIS